jgi:hypothetical protein
MWPTALPTALGASSGGAVNAAAQRSASPGRRAAIAGSLRLKATAERLSARRSRAAQIGRHAKPER